jgi:hypothetical protein
MIGNSLFVPVIYTLEAVDAYAAVEVAFLIDSNELVGFIVLVAIIYSQVHD